jgi:hypothetical protein
MSTSRIATVCNLVIDPGHDVMRGSGIYHTSNMVVRAAPSRFRLSIEELSGILPFASLRRCSMRERMYHNTQAVSVAGTH